MAFHTEVYCALLWSFVGAGVDAEAFVDLQATARVEDVIRSWCSFHTLTFMLQQHEYEVLVTRWRVSHSAYGRYSKPFQAHQDFLGQACDFNLVVFATFPENHIGLAQQAAQSGCSNQRFLMVVHNPYELGNPSKCPPV